MFKQKVGDRKLAIITSLAHSNLKKIKIFSLCIREKKNIMHINMLPQGMR